MSDLIYYEGDDRNHELESELREWLDLDDDTTVVVCGGGIMTIPAGDDIDEDC